MCVCVLIQEVEKPDPKLKKPELYAAAKVNDTEEVLSLLSELVPATYIDKTNGWTVSGIAATPAFKLLSSFVDFMFHMQADW